MELFCLILALTCTPTSKRSEAPRQRHRDDPGTQHSSPEARSPGRQRIRALLRRLQPQSLLSSENLLLLIPAAGALLTALRHRAEAVLCVAGSEPYGRPGGLRGCWRSRPCCLQPRCLTSPRPPPGVLPPDSTPRGVLPRRPRSCCTARGSIPPLWLWGHPHPKSVVGSGDTLWPALRVGAVLPGEPRPDQT